MGAAGKLPSSLRKRAIVALLVIERERDRAGGAVIQPVIIGFDRLVMLATGDEDIEEVLWAPVC